MRSLSRPHTDGCRVPDTLPRLRPRMSGRRSDRRSSGMPIGGMRSRGRKLLEMREVMREGSADGDGTGNGLSTMSTGVALEPFSLLAAQNDHLGRREGFGMRD